MIYHTKHFPGFDIATDSKGRVFILSKTNPEDRPQIGPFRTPAEAIEFGLNRVEK